VYLLQLAPVRSVEAAPMLMYSFFWSFATFAMASAAAEFGTSRTMSALPRS